MSKEIEPALDVEISREEFFVGLREIKKELSTKLLELNLQILSIRRTIEDIQHAESLGMIVKFWGDADGGGVRYHFEPKGKMGLV